MADSYQMIVLGGGTGGYSCALRAADLGLKVALVEKDKVGGTCLHFGCIPTKALLQAAEVAEHAQTAGEYGVNATYDGVDMERVLSFKQKVVDANWKGLQGSLRKRGVDVIAGSGRLKDARTLVVNTEEGERTLTAEKAMVLATGSKPRGLPMDGAEIDGEKVITSDHALFLDRVPQRPIVVGASAVGMEFASVWKGYGSEEVTVIEALPGLVPMEDVDTQKALARDVKKAGMKVHVGAKMTGVEKGSDGVRVTLEGDKKIEGDILMLAIGRGPVSEDMGFEDAGANLDRGFVAVDEYCQVGPEGLYAIGDVIPTLGLAHASFQEGFLVAERVAGQRVIPIDYFGIPKVYYCHPEIGAVGYTEQQLKDKGVDYDKAMFPFSHNARAMMMRGSGHVKVLAEKDNGRVLGVHIVGPRATDLIAEGQLIYNWEALPTDVAQFIHAHPTLTEAVGEAHLQLAGRPLHG
ncbi:MAG: dihydrolipoyl dehydrogenase [Nitriliruptorales bacterium]|nr:dihydrolipoyl dehydrogenase [Nitriliruptorales bacterium]